MKFILKNAAFFAALFFAKNVFSQSRPIATSIFASAAFDKAIEIKWEFPKNAEPKITGSKLYRASKPISSYKEIAALKPIASVSETNFTDTVSKASEYFYAVVATTTQGDYKTIIPGINATTKGVRAMAKVFDQNIEEQKAQNENEAKSEISKTKDSEITKKDSSLLRNMPLPLPTNILNFNEEPRNISSAAKNSVLGLGKEKKIEPIKTPHFFEEDMFSPDGGDEYILFETLRAGLVQRKYQKSVALLQDYLSVNRTKAASSRAEFYLAESLYFCENYQEAVRHFLFVQNDFPELSKKWLDSCLDLIEIENK